MDDTDNVMSSRVALKGKEVESDELEKEKWKKQMSDHSTLVFFVIYWEYFLPKTVKIFSLAKNIHNLLEISLSPSVLPSLRIIPTKYNFIVCYGPTPSTNYSILFAVALVQLSLLKQRTTTSTSLMPFTTYLFKTTLSSARAAKARKAAFNAVVNSLDSQGEGIEKDFGSQRWVAVL